MMFGWDLIKLKDVRREEKLQQQEVKAVQSPTGSLWLASLQQKKLLLHDSLDALLWSEHPGNHGNVSTIHDCHPTSTA